MSPSAMSPPAAEPVTVIVTPDSAALTTSSEVMSSTETVPASADVSAFSAVALISSDELPEPSTI